ncbi:MAG: aminotransferase class V-fold PLP-dependent enzyme [Proteobacteria bacterium]|jgi:aspartate aminotransferase-like enzyme|nr:aminotransferase class V-fold PLP-dependent enzyme [Pseudomonadota bacterium]
MSTNDSLVFKIASEPWEFEQIHELNYQTFVDEIPQHQLNKNKKLVDKYHKENTYVICVSDKEVLGMIALRDKRPLSLDEKLENLESYLPPFKTILEYRLLAVKKQHRNTAIFTGIMKKSFDLAIKGGYDIAVISGTTRQARLYKHLGFKPFGPLVGKQDALYQPMYIDIGGAIELKKQSQILRPKKGSEMEQLLFNYLPGPVSIAEGVMEANSAEPNSHRSQQFMDHFNELRKILCERVNARKVQIMMGSGTLANDVVAAQLSVLPGRGLVLVNGEFGNRLRDQATRAGLDFDVIQVEEGKTFSREMLEEKINQVENLEWIWTVHCETSTGVLNDIDMLRELCNRHNLKLCLDGISSIGSCDVNLQDVYLATAVSGKGIGSLPGLAMVFCREDVVSGDHQLPRYFDLAYYEAKQGIPFTISSNAIYALNAALNNSDWQTRFTNVKQWSEELRTEFEEIGLSILAEPQCRAPHVTTIVLPKAISSLDMGKLLEEEGILVSYRSEYLIAKNQIQVCFMGDCQKPPRMITYFLREALAQTEPHDDSAEAGAA